MLSHDIKTSLLKMEECLVLFISLFLLCTGDQLTPFIAWSNRWALYRQWFTLFYYYLCRDVLTDVPIVNDIDTITTTLATKKDDIEMVIIFASDKVRVCMLSENTQSRWQMNSMGSHAVIYIERGLCYYI